MRAARVWGIAVLGWVLAGCGEGTPPPSPAAVARSPDAVPAPDRSPSSAPAEGGDALQANADRAMLEQRLFAPAGDNAFEYFLALHERAPADAAASTALVQLQPYLVMGIERALAADAAGEARRLLGLLARADAHAAALPRLHGLLAEVDAREVAEAARTATPVAAAPVASAPAPARPVIAAPPTQIAPAPASPAAVPVTAPVAVTAAVTPAETRPLPASAAAAGPALPRLLVDVPPRYPLPALRKRIEGQVEVAFSVLPDGSVRDVRLVDAQPAGLFDASTLAVAQRWRFEATGREHHMQRVVSYRLPAGS